MLSRSKPVPWKEFLAAAIFAVAATSVQAQSIDQRIDAFVAAANAAMPQDPDKMADLFSDDAIIVQETMPSGRIEYQGKDAIVAHFASVETRYSAWDHHETNRIIGESEAVWEGWGKGVDASGRPVKLRMLLTFKFDTDGRVSEQRAYYNVGQLPPPKD